MLLAGAAAYHSKIAKITPPGIKADRKIDLMFALVTPGPLRVRLVPLPYFGFGFSFPAHNQNCLSVAPN
jgi:hypothetical protein